MMNIDNLENSMATLLTHPGAAAQWQALVAEAESAAACPLGEELESYLVFLLMRFNRKPEMADSVLALDYLRGMLAAGRIKHDRLRDVGDQCLLYSGLFPQQAARRRVRIGYFVDLGRSAYQELSARLAGGYADLYALLSQDFVPMMDVLHAVRRLGGARLDPLPAYELWRDTGSRAALQALRETTHGTSFTARDDDALH
ncbi:MAG: hypothetical protein AB1469_05365 [Pseudomonadota bacterium]